MHEIDLGWHNMRARQLLIVSLWLGALQYQCNMINIIVEFTSKTLVLELEMLPMYFYEKFGQILLFFSLGYARSRS